MTLSSLNLVRKAWMLNFDVGYMYCGGVLVEVQRIIELKVEGIGGLLGSGLN